MVSVLEPSINDYTCSVDRAFNTWTAAKAIKLHFYGILTEHKLIWINLTSPQMTESPLSQSMLAQQLQQQRDEEAMLAKEGELKQKMHMYETGDKGCLLPLYTAMLPEWLSFCHSQGEHAYMYTL